jgi:hypothetical protein
VLAGVPDVCVVDVAYFVGASLSRKHVASVPLIPTHAANYEAGKSITMFETAQARFGDRRCLVLAYSKDVIWPIAQTRPAFS